MLWSVLWLILLNIGLWWLTDGHLAWETHLGGALAGAIVAAVWPPREG